MQERSGGALAEAVTYALRVDLPDADPSQATVVGQGWDVVAWRVPAAGGDWLVRVPRIAEATAVLEAQHCLAVLLGTRGVPVPHEPGLLRGPRGEVLAGLYRYVEGDLARGSGRAARRHLATTVAGFLSTLHALDLDFGGQCGARRYLPWPEVYQPLIERCAGLLGPATASWVRATGARLEQASRALPPLALLHADLKPAHILLDHDGAIAAVLDFEGIQVSDPALDFSRLIQHWGRGFASQALRQYRGQVDDGFLVRAQCYRDLDALEVFDTSIRRGWPEWGPWARRALAARAAAATRHQRRTATSK